MTDRIAVALASWIIQDGNYDDFRRGDRVAFALDFYARDGLEAFQPAPAPAPH